VSVNRVQDPEIAIMHGQVHMTNVETARLITPKHAITFETMLNAIGDCLKNLQSSDVTEGWEDPDVDHGKLVLGKMSEDDEPGCTMDTLSRMEQHHIDSFLRKQGRIDNGSQPGWRVEAEYFCGRVLMCWTTHMNVPAVLTPHTDTTAATHSPTTGGLLIQVVDIVP